MTGVQTCALPIWLGELAAQCTVVVGVTNPLGTDAPDHELHDHRILTEGD